MGGGVFSNWKNSFICGWNFDNIERLKEMYTRRNGSSSYSSWDNETEAYKDSYEQNIEKITTETNAKLNLGGSNDKAKIEFSDKPIEIFDFSLASQLLYRVQEFYSEKLKNENPFLFKEYDVVSGIVPNYFVQKEVLGNVTQFYYINSSTQNKYILEKRQKGLTQVLEVNPNLETVMQNDMLIPIKPVKGIVFSSRVKKPYVKYKKRGGKVKYVEIYSLFYYSNMDGDFAKSVRHLPVVLVTEYLEKMGTLTKFFVTRFVQQSLSNATNPLQYDIETNAQLPLFDCVSLKGRRNFSDKLVVQPICVKEYGEEMDKSFVYGVSSERKSMYETTYNAMVQHELENNNTDPYGAPDWDDEYYQEGFERFRQKHNEYVAKGIWKAKEVTAQGLVFFHDLFLNNNWESKLTSLRRITETKYPNFMNDYRLTSGIEREPFLIGYSPENINWFDLWIRISANTIKHKLDIFNSNNPIKTYQIVFRELQEIIDEINLLINNETNIQLKSFFESWANDIYRKYEINNPKSYCENRINEMTFYAKGGCFATPDEDIIKRNAEASRLKTELIKI
jgi:hypothetical protein